MSYLESTLDKMGISRGKNSLKITAAPEMTKCPFPRVENPVFCEKDRRSSAKVYILLISRNAEGCRLRNYSTHKEEKNI